MKFLVTGATGRIGSRLVPRLLQRGDSVRILVRDPDRAHALNEQGAETVVGDLLNEDRLAGAVAGMDAVIHLAAFFRGATPEQSRRVNLDGALSLARAAIEAGVSRFIFASTNLVYEPGSENRFRENDPVRPTAPYPKTKSGWRAGFDGAASQPGTGLANCSTCFRLRRR